MNCEFLTRLGQLAWIFVEVADEATGVGVTSCQLPKIVNLSRDRRRRLRSVVSQGAGLRYDGLRARF